MNEKSFDRFVERLKNRFDESVEELDSGKVSRITQIRYRSLEQAGRRPRMIFWLPASALATACLVLLVYSLLPEQQIEEGSFVDEIEIISELDFYEELEFYEWLEQQELPV